MAAFIKMLNLLQQNLFFHSITCIRSTTQIIIEQCSKKLPTSLPYSWDEGISCDGLVIKNLHRSWRPLTTELSNECWGNVKSTSLVTNETFEILLLMFITSDLKASSGPLNRFWFIEEQLFHDVQSSCQYLKVPTYF